MITDAQVRRLMKLNQSEDTLSLAAAKAGMDEKTARKYRQAGRLPSQLRVEHTWRTRPDAFEEVWSMLEGMLGINSGLEAKTLFGDPPVRWMVRSSGFLRLFFSSLWVVFSPETCSRYQRSIVFSCG